MVKNFLLELLDLEVVIKLILNLFFNNSFTKYLAVKPKPKQTKLIDLDCFSMNCLIR